MPNIKITAEVDGKQVPLETVSTETFEAIKALEKPKEIPVARVGNCIGNLNDKRLLLKLTDDIRETIAKDHIDVIAINLQNKCVNNIWRNDNEAINIRLYENVRPL